MEGKKRIIVDYGDPVDMTKGIIKVIGVGGGGCSAVKNMYQDGIKDVTFAVCNTDSQSLSKSIVPVKVLLGDSGLGVGGVPEVGKKEAEDSIDKIKSLFSDDTKMVFITAGMGGGTGTGAGPVVAGVAKKLGMLTIGVVTIPFYFEKEKKIIKALKGVEEMRKNVDALLIVNNERICNVYSGTRISVKEAFKRADEILSNAVKSISELITIEGDINLDFRDVESTMKSGGGAIMAIGRAGGEHRVEKAIIDALDSPLLYGSDISRAKRILFNIYTSADCPLFVDELQEIDAFMDELSPQIEVIWGVSDDNTLGEDAKIAILATGLDNEADDFAVTRASRGDDEVNHYRDLIKKLYSPGTGSSEAKSQQPDTVPLIVNGNGEAERNGETAATTTGETAADTTDNDKDATETTTGDDKTDNDDASTNTGDDTDTGATRHEPHVPQPPSGTKRLVERLKKIWNEMLKEPSNDL